MSKRPRISFGGAFFSPDAAPAQRTDLLSEEDKPLTEQSMNLEKVDVEESPENAEAGSSAPPVSREIVEEVVAPCPISSPEKNDSGRYRAPKGEFGGTVLSIEGAGDRNTSVRVTKAMLSNASAIAQADHKFVLARAGAMLIAVDQHAADERVQLERLEKETYAGLSTGIHAKGSTLCPPVMLALSGIEQSLLDLHAPSLEKFGFHFSLPESKIGDPNCTVVVTAAPAVMGVGLTGEDMRVMLHQLDEFDPAGSGLQIKPPVIQYILCSKACRGAVMFGDALAQSECDLLLKGLAKCELPFQCAHGRPSSVVLVKDMHLMSERREKLLASAPPSRWGSWVKKTKLDLGRISRKPEHPKNI
mmetsp:Transcript_23794/g.43521  ORF Transcript_23794/g.43521 Transcript_23794/m.43521 type:complete len:360 (+) Transcript_23794:1605-2684(+)